MMAVSVVLHTLVRLLHDMLPPPQVVAQLPHHMVEAVAARLPEAIPAGRRRLLKEHEHHKHRKHTYYKKHHKPPVGPLCRSAMLTST